MSNRVEIGLAKRNCGICLGSGSVETCGRGCCGEPCSCIPIAEDLSSEWSTPFANGVAGQIAVNTNALATGMVDGVTYKMELPTIRRTQKGFDIRVSAVPIEFDRNFLPKAECSHCKGTGAAVWGPGEGDPNCHYCKGTGEEP